MRRQPSVATGSLLVTTASLSFGVAAVFAISACSPPPEARLEAETAGASAAQRDADIQAILDLEQAVFDAENSGDFETWFSFIDDDPVWMPPNDSVMTDREAIRRWAAPSFEQYDLHEETTAREVDVAGDWGYIRAHWTWTVTPKAGGESVSDSGKSIWIVRRQLDGSWKMARAIWNSDNPSLRP